MVLRSASLMSGAPFSALETVPLETPTFLAISSMVGIRICTPFPLNLTGMTARHVQHLLYLSWMQKANHETYTKVSLLGASCGAHHQNACKSDTFLVYCS